MDKEDWAKIQINWKKLTKDLVWSSFRDQLVDRGVLDEEDVQRIEKEKKVQAVQNETFLNILKSKPKRLQAFKHFLEILCSDADDLAKALEGTVVLPQYFEAKEETEREAVRLALQVFYEEKQGCQVRLPLLRRTLETELLKEGHNFDWKDERICDFVKHVFSASVRINRGRKRRLSIENISQRAPTHQREAPEPLEVASAGSCAPRRVPVPDMTVEQLQEHLGPILSRSDLPEEILATFKKQDINGRAFLLLDEDKIERLLPDLTMGKRWVLLDEMKKMRESPTGASATTSGDSDGKAQNGSLRQYRESFRKFDCPLATGERYGQGKLLETSTGGSGALLTPTRRFVLLKGNVEEGGKRPEPAEVQIAKETIPFAAALLNERRNGTIFFGVSPAEREGHLAGEVVGMTVDKEACTKALQDFIQKSFPPDLAEVARITIRSPQFVEVSSESGSKYHRHVVEIDVVPTSRFVKANAFFVKKNQRGKLLLYRLNGTDPMSLSDEEMSRFMDTKNDLTAERARLERGKVSSGPSVNLQKKIKNLFAGGHDTLDDNVFPILMLSPLNTHMDSDFIQDNLYFIKHIDARAVFDFDPTGSEKGLYHYMDQEDQVMRVLTTENFDKSRQETATEKRKYITFLESLKTFDQRNWVFCNGYSCMEMKPMSATEWYNERSRGFRDALCYYEDTMPKQRGLVMFFLFSKNYETMLEMAKEVLVMFKKQWMVIAEDEAVAAMWMDTLSQRGLRREELEERCVVGMPWGQVNDTFLGILKPEKSMQCELPLATGATCVMTEKAKNEKTDLEVLGINECHNADLPDESLENTRQTVEKKFYCGAEASWWNYSFGEDHVLHRDKHQDLTEAVEAALGREEETEDKVGVVVLQHQPGAGGTTSAKQVLWDLRQKYRCCVVRKLTDETCDQIAEFRRYGESANPKPCLVLVDNHSEDGLRKLRAKLENKARILARESEESLRVFCVLLVCMRLADLPLQANSQTIQLRQELTPAELARFSRKYDALLKKHKEEDKHVDPKSLLSFNILKENFNPSYIKKTVQDHLKDIRGEGEKKILKYLSFINYFDIDRRPVPVSCFDPLMTSGERLVARWGIVAFGETRKSGWEIHMSASMRTLLNVSSRRQRGSQVMYLCIIHPLLSREILDSIREMPSQSISSILAELLNFALASVGRQAETLLEAIKDIVKRRAVKDGRLQQFSPIITEVRDNEGVDSAAEVLELVFEKTDDAFVAQHAARFFMYTKNWLNAEHYAKTAIRIAPDHSYLKDTLGQVYRRQAIEKYTQGKEGQATFDNQKTSEMIQLTRKAIGFFREEQSMSQMVQNLSVNNCGYFGELRAIIVLLNTLPFCECYIDHSRLHKFLVDKNYVPPKFSFLTDDEKRFLKSLHADTLRGLQILEDGFLQLRDDRNEEIKRTEMFLDRKSLVHMKEDLAFFFGEDTDDPPSDAIPRDACEFRRRRAIRLGGSSLGSMSVRDSSDLNRIAQLMYENVQSEHCNAYDIVTFLGAMLLLHANGLRDLGISVQELTTLTCRLYEKRNEDGGNHLECYLYFVLFNFPTPFRVMNGLCQSPCNQETFRQWKEAFEKKYPKFKQDEDGSRKRDTTLFFFGKGEGLSEIVFYDELHEMRGTKTLRGDGFWRLPKAVDRLRRFEGLLRMDGLEIEVQVATAAGNKYPLCIPTSMPIHKSAMWQKRVFFVLGMSWSGPRAFDVTSEETVLEMAPRVQKISSQDRARSNPGPAASKPANLEPSQPRTDGTTSRLSRLHDELRQVQQELQELSQTQMNKKDKRKKTRNLERKKLELHQSLEELLASTS